MDFNKKSMGICVQSSHHQKKPAGNETPLTSTKETTTKRYASHFEESKFPDMPEWEGERYKGFGIKKMKGYICKLNIQDLNKLREDFWAAKNTHKEKWRIIRQACVFDYIKAEEYLSRFGMKTLHGCINIIIDSEQNLYKIPNFCINDPYFEKEVLPESQDEPHDTVLTIRVTDLQQRKLSFKVQENTKGIEIKKKYAEITNINLDEYKIRLLFGGNFIEDNQALYQHKVQDGYTIQVVANKKPKEEMK